jgi:hypothetical protein
MHAAQVDEARQEPAWPEPTWPSHGRLAEEPGWAVPASGEPLPVPGVASAPPDTGQPGEPLRFSGSAPVSPAVPFHPGPTRPGPTPPYPGQPRAVTPSYVDGQRTASAPGIANRHDTPIPVNGATRPDTVARPGAPTRHDGATPSDPDGPGLLFRAGDPIGPEPVPDPDPEPVPVRDPVLDDPWADPARYAAVYRESMSAIRAASVGAAAAQALAEAEDRAAVQAAYAAAVESPRGGAGRGHQASAVPGNQSQLAPPDQAHDLDQPRHLDPPRQSAPATQPHRAGLSLSEQTQLAAGLAHPDEPPHPAAPGQSAVARPAAAPGHRAAQVPPAVTHPAPARARVHPADAQPYPADAQPAAAAAQPSTGSISPNTPIGQPSLADHRDRPRPGDMGAPGDGVDAREPRTAREAAARLATADREAPSPRDILIPRQPGPTDQGAAAGQPVRSVPMTQPVPMGQGAPYGQAAHSMPPEAAARAGQPDPSGQPGPAEQPVRHGQEGSTLPVPPVLPQRVPAAPDVPEVPDDVADEDFVDHGPDLVAVNQPELARIATGLRYNEDLEEPPRPDGFDTLAVLAAVRAVPGVRDAQLRPSPTGGGVHTLRLDLADGADGAQVSRLVARLLKQRMGLAAEPRRSTEPRRAPAASPAPNTGQPHRDPGAMPVAGTAPAPRMPVPASAAEQLTGPVATNASDDRTRRRPVPAARGRDIESTEPHRVIRSAAGPRVVIDQVQVSTLGLDATVEVRLTSGGTPAIGVASGPAVDGYVLRLAAVAATAALDQLLATVDSWEQPGRCFVEHAAVVPFGGVDVAVVVLLLVCGNSAEQLTGSALVAGDPRQAVVRATLAAMNRRLDTLLS